MNALGIGMALLLSPCLQTGVDVQEQATPPAATAQEHLAEPPEEAPAPSPSNVPITDEDDASSEEEREPAPRSTGGKSLQPEQVAPADEAAKSEPDTAPVPDKERFAITRVAVYDLTTNGVTDKFAKVMSDAIIAELRKRKGLVVLGVRELQAMLDVEAQKEVMGCTEDSCLIEIADALGVDTVVAGSLTRVGEERQVLVRRIEQRRAAVAGTYSKRVLLDDEVEMLATVGPAVAELFRDHELLPGQSQGVDPEVALRFDPPPLPAWAFYSVGAASGALLAGAGVVGALDLALYWFVYLPLLAQGQSAQGASEQDALNIQAGINALGAATWVLMAGAFVVGVVAAGLIPFTDFWGYGEESG